MIRSNRHRRLGAGGLAGTRMEGSSELGSGIGRSQDNAMEFATQEASLESDASLAHDADSNCEIAGPLEESILPSLANGVDVNQMLRGSALV